MFCFFCSCSWPVFFFPCSVLVHMPYVNGASGRAPVGPLAGKGRGRGEGAKRRRGAASNKPLPSPSPVHVGAKKKLIWHAPRGGPRHPRGAGGGAREGGAPQGPRPAQMDFPGSAAIPAQYPAPTPKKLIFLPTNASANIGKQSSCPSDRVDQPIGIVEVIP